MYLCTDGEVTYMHDSDKVSLENEIPVGIYKLGFSKFTGSKLEPFEDFKLSHGKIYGKSQMIANHIVESFRKTDKTKNLGVLLSGGRGLGKTLTTRLIIEQLKDEFPVVSISEYTPDLADFLSHLKGCVILMDEFEKFMGGNIRGNDAEDEQTKQETLLSVLDGNTGSSGNLFLFTVNDTYKLDENLKSRPGRIRYHYKFESEAAEVVRAYCKDNLNRSEVTEDVVRILGSTKYVSMDIITAFVDELNKFPDLSPEEIKDFLNIESSERIFEYTLVLNTPYGHLHYSTDWTEVDMPTDRWFSLKPADERKLMLRAGKEYVRHISASLEGECPTYIYGTEKFDPSIASLEECSFSNGRNNEIFEDYAEAENWQLVSVEVRDKDFDSFSKKYNKAAY